MDKDGTARCQCPRYCPYKDAYKKLGQVCATDGKTYKDVCHMLHHSCREGKKLSVAFYGVCQSDSKWNILWYNGDILGHCQTSMMGLVSRNS